MSEKTDLTAAWMKALAEAIWHFPEAWDQMFAVYENGAWVVPRDKFMLVGFVLNEPHKIRHAQGDEETK